MPYRKGGQVTVTWTVLCINLCVLIVMYLPSKRTETHLEFLPLSQHFYFVAFLPLAIPFQISNLMCLPVLALLTQRRQTVRMTR